MSSVPSEAERVGLETCETLDTLFDKLKEQSGSELYTQKFRELLAGCSINSLGALRAFHDSVPDLVAMILYDESDAMQKLQMRGFLACVRVRARLLISRPPMQFNCPRVLGGRRTVHPFRFHPFRLCRWLAQDQGQDAKAKVRAAAKVQPPRAG